MGFIALEGEAMHKTPIKPGIYPDISDAEYRRIDALSRSDLMEWAGLCKPISEEAAATGTAFHLAMLQPHLLKESVIWPDQPIDRRTKEGKAAWQHWTDKASEEGKTLIRHGTLDKLRAMVGAVRRDKTLGPLHTAAVKGVTRNEVTIVWEFEGVLLKARLDQVTGKAIIDWKSTSLIDPDEYAQACIKYGYHIQAPMYQDGWMACTGEILPFVHAVTSKREPHPCWLHRMDIRDTDHGRAFYQSLVRIYKKQEIAA